MATAYDLYSRWQPIATAPKDGTAILAYFGGIVEYMTSPFGIVEFVSEGWRLIDDEEHWPIELHLLTHWMPLPAPPPVEPKEES